MQDISIFLLQQDIVGREKGLNIICQGEVDILRLVFLIDDRHIEEPVVIALRIGRQLFGLQGQAHRHELSVTTDAESLHRITQRTDIEMITLRHEGGIIGRHANTAHGITRMKVHAHQAT